jgi:hypothetical protein
MTKNAMMMPNSTQMMTEREFCRSFASIGEADSNGGGRIAQGEGPE